MKKEIVFFTIFFHNYTFMCIGPMICNQQKLSYLIFCSCNLTKEQQPEPNISNIYIQNQLALFFVLFYLFAPEYCSCIFIDERENRLISIERMKMYQI